MRYLLLLLVCFVFALSGTAFAEAPKKTMGQIRNNPIVLQGESARMAVVFNHKSHRGPDFACKTCHHESSAPKTSISSCTESCHTIPGARERDPMSMFMAFHDKGTERSCYGCHTRLARENPAKYKDFGGCRPCHGPGAKTPAMLGAK